VPLIHVVVHPRAYDAARNLRSQREYDPVVGAALALAELDVLLYDLALPDVVARYAAEVVDVSTWSAHPCRCGSCIFGLGHHCMLHKDRPQHFAEASNCGG